jgi:hypothetical protein
MTTADVSKKRARYPVPGSARRCSTAPGQPDMNSKVVVGQRRDESVVAAQPLYQHTHARNTRPHPIQLGRASSADVIASDRIRQAATRCSPVQRTHDGWRPAASPEDVNLRAETITRIQLLDVGRPAKSPCEFRLAGRLLQRGETFGVAQHPRAAIVRDEGDRAAARREAVCDADKSALHPNANERHVRRSETRTDHSRLSRKETTLQNVSFEGRGG